MKRYFLLTTLIFGLSHPVHSQRDTLMANNTHTLALFFPSDIRQGITGSDNFTFSFNPDGNQRLGLLQASPGPQSNLLVLTADEKAYAYELRYEPNLPELYRFIEVNESINTPLVGYLQLDSIMTNQLEKPTIDSLYLLKGSTYVLDRSDSVLKAKSHYHISLRLMQMAYYGREVFLVIELENDSRIDFEVAYLHCYTTLGNPGRKSSYQKKELTSIYEYKVPEIIRAASSNKFVIVLPKFTLADREKLLIEVQEKYGNRSLSLQY